MESATFVEKSRIQEDWKNKKYVRDPRCNETDALPYSSPIPEVLPSHQSRDGSHEENQTGSLEKEIRYLTQEQQHGPSCLRHQIPNAIQLAYPLLGIPSRKGRLGKDEAHASVDDLQMVVPCLEQESHLQTL